MTDAPERIWLDPMPRQDIELPPPVGFVSREDYTALQARLAEMEAERVMSRAAYDSVSSLLLSVQQDCIREHNRAEAAATTSRTDALVAARQLVGIWDNSEGPDVYPGVYYAPRGYEQGWLDAIEHAQKQILALTTKETK